MTNTTLQNEEIGFRCASALLLYKGQIAVRDIQALPFIENDSQTELIIEALKQRYDVEIKSEKISSWPFLEWDEIIRLRRIGV